MESCNIAFCNVSFGEKYVATQKRLIESILLIYPDATLFFWTDELPPNSKPFQESLYGFKVHAIQHARDKGFTKVVWIDTCAILKSKVEPLFEAGFIAVKDENKLYKHWRDDVGPTAKEFNLVGGSLYCFDFDKPEQIHIFNKWKDLEKKGLFGTQEFIMNQKNDGIEKCGWRMDESCMAFVLYDMIHTPHDRTLYDTIIEKKHFLNEGEKWYN